MADELLEHLVRGVDHAQVPDHEAAPVEAADAPARVAPGDARAEDQFTMGVGVAAGVVELVPDPCPTRLERAGIRGLPVVEPEELLRLRLVHRCVGIPRRNRHTSVSRNTHAVTSQCSAPVVRA